METLNILLVDDEPEFVESLAERLRLRGFTTRIAPDGASALELLRQEQFQGVVLDVMMPGMDGLETLKEIKKIDELNLDGMLCLREKDHAAQR